MAIVETKLAAFLTAGALLVTGGAAVAVAGFGGSQTYVQCQSPGPSSTAVSPEDVSLSSGGIPIIPGPGGQTISLQGQGLQDAELIAGIGFALEKQPPTANQPVVNDNDVIAAEMGAIAESRLLNLTYGDRDSLGLYQQRPSILGANGVPYWGTATQILNPVYAINRFYRELLWRESQIGPQSGAIGLGVLVQAVQASGYPAGYAPWYGQAVAIVTALKPTQSGTPVAQTVALTTADDANANTCQGQQGETLPNDTSGPSSAQGWHVPLAGNFIITQGYTWNGSSGHPGVDLSGANIYGRPILAAADGVVESHLPDPYGYGNYVELGHAGNIETIYGHMVQIAPGIIPGVQVKAGQVIGYADSTGDSTGNHLHFEVHINGVRVNALTFMLQRGINLANYGSTAIAA